MHRQSDKNLLNSNVSPTSPHNMAIFGLLTAEIGSGVWGTPTHCNGFCVLAALLHRTLVAGVSQNAVLNRGRHLYSAGRPSFGHRPTFLVSFEFIPATSSFYCDVWCIRWLCFVWWKTTLQCINNQAVIRVSLCNYYATHVSHVVNSSLKIKYCSCIFGQFDGPCLVYNTAIHTVCSRCGQYGRCIVHTDRFQANEFCRRRRSLRPQAKASMPASFNQFTIWLLAKVLHINDSSCKHSLRLPVPCNCALKLYIIFWLCQNLSSLALNVLVVLADTTQLGKLFHVFTTLFEKQNL